METDPSHRKGKRKTSTPLKKKVNVVQIQFGRNNSQENSSVTDWLVKQYEAT